MKMTVKARRKLRAMRKKIRHTEERQAVCHNKRSFMTKQEAEKVSALFGVTGKPIPHRAYRCDLCEDWHLATTKHGIRG